MFWLKIVRVYGESHGSSQLRTAYSIHFCTSFFFLSVKWIHSSNVIKAQTLIWSPIFHESVMWVGRIFLSVRPLKANTHHCDSHVCSSQWPLHAYCILWACGLSSCFSTPCNTALIVGPCWAAWTFHCNTSLKKKQEMSQWCRMMCSTAKRNRFCFKVLYLGYHIVFIDCTWALSLKTYEGKIQLGFSNHSKILWNIINATD